MSGTNFMTFRCFLEASENFRVTRGTDNSFEAWLGKKKIGQAYISSARNGEYILHAIDIFDESEEGGINYQKQGYGTKLMQAIAKWLKSVGAKSLSSSNEGSGTVQMLDRVFGRKNVQHFHGGRPVSYEDAVKVMDVDYGYTGSKVNLK